jgi:molybdopterin-synthase adenylyltransferase
MSIHELIEIHAKPSAVGKETLPTIDMNAIAEIAAKTGLSRREVAIRALERGVVPLRFLAHRGTVPQADLARLLRARVAVCGLGGLGGHIVTLLARVGVGQLVLIDGDTFAETNLNRQVFCTLAALGRSKAEVTREGVEGITDLTEVIAHTSWITDENARELLEGCDAAVDGFDNLKGRAVTRRACVALGIPYVGSGVNGLGGWVGTINASDPDFIPVITAPDFLPPDPPVEGSTPDTDPGVFPAIPHIMAGFQVVEVFRLICKRGPSPGGLLAMNPFSWSFVPKRLS